MSKGKKGELDTVPVEAETGELVGVTFKDRAEKPKKNGRPTKYNDELIAQICTRLSYGESLRSICRDEEMPEGTTVWRWLNEPDKQTFREQYARAKEESADALADDIQNIADKTLRGEYEPQASRVAIDAYKWTASKLKPKKYGDKIDMTTNGKDLPMPIISLPNATLDIQHSIPEDTVPEISG